MDGPPRDRPDPEDDDLTASRSDSQEDHDLGIGPRGSAADDAGPDDRSPRDDGSGVETDVDDPLGDLLPRAGVDSRWWYWIAAIPLYVVLGGLLAVLFVGALLLGLAFDGGVLFIALLVLLVPTVGIGGLVLSVLFPIATYVDARAIAESDAHWTPDPLIWGLAALATVVLSAFTLSVLQAIYYLYKRHVAVGTP